MKEAAARTNKTLGQIIEESLEFYGIKTTDGARALVERARRSSGLTLAQAGNLAVRETREQRKERGS